MKKTWTLPVIFSGLEKTMIFWFILIMFIPLFIIISIGYFTSKEVITSDAQTILTIKTYAEAKRMESHVSQIMLELEIQSKNQNNLLFFNKIKKAFEISGQSPILFTKSYEWMEMADQEGGMLRDFQKIYNYADILFIDPNGNILFSVSQEDDLGINIFKDQNGDTLLAKAVKNVQNENRPSFSGFERYSSSNSGVAGFFVRDMIDITGQRIGFIVFRVNPEPFIPSLVSEFGVAENVKSYLIKDNLVILFSASLEKKNIDLANYLDTALAKKWYTVHMGIDDTDRELYHNIMFYNNKTGKEVIGFLYEIHILDKRYALVTEIDKKHIFKAVVDLLKYILVVTIFIVVMVSLLAVKVARHITIPIIDLTHSAARVAKGNYDEVIRINSDNEIGTLARNFNEMIHNLKVSMKSKEKEIQKRRELEQRTQQALETTQTLVENIPVGIILVGPDKRIRKANNTVLKMIGIDSDQEIIGSLCHHHSICPAETRQCPVFNLGQKMENTETTLLTKGNEELSILKTCLPIRLEGEDLVLETFVDITERKKIETVLADNLKTLSESNKRLKVLVSGTVEREKRMVLLKQEVNDLLLKSNRKRKYKAPGEIHDQGFKL